MKLSLPIRVSVPACLLAVTFLLTAISVASDRYTSARSIEQVVVPRGVALNDLIAPPLASAMKLGDRAAVRKMLEHMGVTPYVSVALVRGTDDRVTDSSAGPLRGQLFRAVRGASAQQLVARACRAGATQWQVSPDGEIVQVATPLDLGSRASGDAPLAAVYTEHNLGARRRHDERLVYARGALFVAAALAICILVWLFMRAVFTRDMDQLRSVTTAYASGDTSVRVADTGNHELAEIGRVVNQMLGDVAERTRALGESEARSRALFNSADDAVFLVDLDADTKPGAIEDVNDAAVELFGYSREEFTSMAIADLVAPEFAGNAPANVRRVQSEGRATFETAISAKDGRAIPVEISARLVDIGRRRLGVAIARDITERKRADQELRESRVLLRQVEELAGVGGWDWDVDRRVMTWTEQVRRILGFQPEEFSSGSERHLVRVLACYAPEDRDTVRTAFYRCIEEGTPYSFEVPMTTADGRSIWAQVSARAVTEAGRTVRVVGHIADITERRRHEEALRLNSMVLDQIHDQIVITDLDGAITYANQAQKRVLGLEPGFPIGKPIDVLGEAPDRAAAQREILEITLREGAWRGEVVSHGADGSEHVLDCRTQLVRDGSGTAVALCGISTDITEQKRADDALRESERQQRVILQAAMDGFCRVDEDGHVLEVNEKYCQMAGRTEAELLGLTLSDINAVEAPHQIASHIQAIQRVGHDRFETRYRRRDGSTFDVEVRAQRHPLNSGQVIAFVRDITDQKRAAKDNEATLGVLEILNARTGLRPMMRALLLYMRSVSGCDAVGIRLRDGDDYPYYETSGFDTSFVRKENHLCARSDDGSIVRDAAGNPVLECMCGNIIRGRFDPSLPFFTKGGSFVSNGTTKLLASTTEADRQARTRNRCNGEGYESVMLVPLRAAGETFGLLQFNHRSGAKFSDHFVALIERLAGDVAIALAQRQTEQALREERDVLQGVMDGAGHTHLAYLDRGFRFVRVNEAYAESCGCRPDELVGRSYFALFPDAEMEAVFSRVRDAGEAFHAQDRPFAHPHRREPGTTYWDWTLTPVTGPRGDVTGLVLSLHETTDRMRAEAERQELSRQRQIALSAANLGWWHYDPVARISTWDDRCREIFGAAGNASANEDMLTPVDPDDLPGVRAAVEAALDPADPRPYAAEFRVNVPDGSVRWVSAHGLAEFEGEGASRHAARFVGTVADITPSKRAEAEIRQALADKEALLKEVHHRVKNNLQMVSGLLLLQSEGIPDPRMVELLTESQGRIKSLALVHQKLYQSSDLAHLDCQVYIRDLAADLMRAHTLAGQRVALDIAVPPIALDLSAAIPCALLLNELLTNAVKHAFIDRPADPANVVRIEWTDGGEWWRLAVSDNGRGMPAEMDTEPAATLGVRLVRMLARQLRGTARLEPGPGCRWVIEFPKAGAPARRSC